MTDLDTENKTAWCKNAETDEHAFAVNRLYQLGIAGSVNPTKRRDPYTHDLLVNFPADLKTIRTPLFKAQEIYGLDPQYAITFNRKDAERYQQLYPNIIVIFDINWTQTTKQIGHTTYTVQPMHVTCAGFLHDIRRAITADGNHEHTYQKRIEDTAGNAKTSFVFDARHLHRLTEADC